MRITDLVLLTGAVAGAIYTFQIKHEAEQSAKQLATLKAQIGAQNRKIALLEADWALETGPARLEEISIRYVDQLHLRAMESTQIIDHTELPEIRPEPANEADERFVGEEEQLTTGGIGQLIERAAKN
jgi:hypothetical protein